MTKKLHYKAWKTLLSCLLIFFFVSQAKANTLIVPGNDTLYIEQCDSFIPPTATAYDSAQNIVNGANISLSYSPRLNTCVIQLYTLTYLWKDSAGNTIDSKIKYLVIIPDSTKPLLVVHGGKVNNGRLEDFVAVKEVYTAPRATAQDNVDGNLSGSIMVDNIVNTQQLGTYTVTYSVADASNNKTEKILYVIVGDTIAPTINITDTHNDTLYIGDFFDFNEHDVTYSDNYGGASDITVAQFGDFHLGFDTSSKAIKAGTYIIGYKAVDKSGNVSKDSMFIHVIDTTYTISGAISLGSVNQNFNRNATVYLIKFNASDSSLTAVNTYNITSGNGSQFSFNSVSQGSYLIKAALDSADSLYTDYLPTYYNGSLTWNNAQTITVTGNTTINISLLAGTNTGGPGFISGKVSQGANKKEGDPLENIQILLTTEDDKPVAYTYSDKNGYFEFKNLALQTYKVAGEVAGKKAFGAEILLTEEKMEHNDILVVVNSQAVVTYTEKILSIGKNNSQFQTLIYPNPASNKIYINTNGNSNNILQQVKLYNTAGQLVIVQNPVSAKSAVVEVSALVNGIYFLELIYNDQATERTKVIVVH